MAFLPSVANLIIAIFYLALQLYTASIMMSATIIAIAIILFCFFVRYIPKYSDAIMAMPVLYGIRLPFTLPISFGLFYTPITIIPTCIGIFAYYFLVGINKNIGTLEQVKNSDDPFEVYTNTIKSVISNQAMFSSMIVFSIVIIVVYIIRNLKIDYAFEIASAAGAAASMLGMFILMLRYEVGFGIAGVIFGSIISGAISYFIIFMVRPLGYAAVENVQFEDDDYYYYVRAVPKLKDLGNKVEIKHVVGRTDDRNAGKINGTSSTSDGFNYGGKDVFTKDLNEISATSEADIKQESSGGFRIAGLLTGITALTTQAHKHLSKNAATKAQATRNAATKAQSTRNAATKAQSSKNVASKSQTTKNLNSEIAKNSRTKTTTNAAEGKITNASITRTKTDMLRKNPDGMAVREGRQRSTVSENKNYPGSTVQRRASSGTGEMSRRGASSGTGEMSRRGASSGTGEMAQRRASSGTGEMSQRRASSGTGEMSKRRASSGTGEMSQRRASSGTGEMAQRRASSGTGEMSQRRASSGTGEMSQRRASSGTGEMAQRRASSGTGEMSQRRASSGTGEMAQRRASSGTGEMSQRRASSGTGEMSRRRPSSGTENVTRRKAYTGSSAENSVVDRRNKL
jgi:hypothetical protein